MAGSIDSTLEALGRQPFRARFHLRGPDAATVELRGMEVIRRHADELLTTRLAPAAPHNDGKQTPYRGHPVFVAQPLDRDGNGRLGAACAALTGRRTLSRRHERSRPPRAS